MIRSLIYSLTFHSAMILITILSLPFMLREPIDLPPIVSVELIQISDKTNIPYAPKARKIIEETKKKEEEQERKNMILERRMIINVHGITKDMYDKMGEHATQNGLFWDAFEGRAINPETKMVDEKFMKMYVENQLEPFYRLAQNATDDRYYYDSQYSRRVLDRQNEMEVAWDWYEDQGRQFMR